MGQSFQILTRFFQKLCHNSSIFQNSMKNEVIQVMNMYCPSSNCFVNRTSIPCEKLRSFLGTSETIARNRHLEPSPGTITRNLKYALVRNMAIQLLNATFDFCENKFTRKCFLQSLQSQSTNWKFLGTTLYSY